MYIRKRMSNLQYTIEENYIPGCITFPRYRCKKCKNIMDEIHDNYMCSLCLNGLGCNKLCTLSGIECKKCNIKISFND